MDESAIEEVRRSFERMGHLDPILDVIVHECLPKFMVSEISFHTTDGYSEIFSLEIPAYLICSDMAEWKDILKKWATPTGLPGTYRDASPNGTVTSISMINDRKPTASFVKYQESSCASWIITPYRTVFDISLLTEDGYHSIIYSEDCSSTRLLIEKKFDHIRLWMNGEHTYEPENIPDDQLGDLTISARSEDVTGPLSFEDIRRTFLYQLYSMRV
jgi:hypothetical protein